MADKMRIDVSIASDDVGKIYHKGQKVSFINVFNNATKTTTVPVKRSYDTSGNTEVDFTALLNYQNYVEAGGSRRYNISEGFAPIYKSDYQTLDVFRREVSTIIGDKVVYNRLLSSERFKINNLEEAQKEEDLYFGLIGGTKYYPISDYKEKEYGVFTQYYPILYRKIVTPNNEIVETPLTTLELVGSNINSFNFKDFNITNDRTYQYILYPIISGDKLVREEIIVHTKWEAWSITELHPVDKSGKNFRASNDDVWLFNFNLESGSQSQNISRTEQQTLGAYPRYSQGRKNYVGGDINCLLGSEVIPASYVEKNGHVIRNGGYVERRIFDLHPTSNEKIDMLKAWRKIVYSNNPKLLKDRAGQSFLITITQSSNKPYDGVKNQPNTLSFSWVQIGDTKDVSILDIQ